MKAPQFSVGAVKTRDMPLVILLMKDLKENPGQLDLFGWVVLARRIGIPYSRAVRMISTLLK